MQFTTYFTAQPSSCQYLQVLNASFISSITRHCYVFSTTLIVVCVQASYCQHTGCVERLCWILHFTSKTGGLRFIREENETKTIICPICNQSVECDSCAVLSPLSSGSICFCTGIALYRWYHNAKKLTIFMYYDKRNRAVQLVTTHLFCKPQSVLAYLYFQLVLDVLYCK